MAYISIISYNIVVSLSGYAEYLMHRNFQVGEVPLVAYLVGEVTSELDVSRVNAKMVLVVMHKPVVAYVKLDGMERPVNCHVTKFVLISLQNQNF